MIEGRASDQLLEAVGSGLPATPGNGRVLVVGFAFADIPLGTTLDHWWPAGNPEAVVVAEARITAVTQQFAISWPEIPEGWKTIVLMTFPGAVPAIVDDLETVDGWYQHPTAVHLGGQSTWAHHSG